MKRKVSTIAVAVLTTACLAMAQTEPDLDAVRAFYFGNSLTGSAMPKLHGELGKTAGKAWICDVFAGAGWPSWMHRNELWRAMGRPIDAGTQSASSRGDLTLDEDLAKTAPHKPRKFFAGEWDAIVIQVFYSWLKDVRTEQWGTTFDGPVDLGDIAAISDIIRIFLEKNPNGKVYIYTVWPNMKSGQVPPDDELPEWAIAMKKKRGSIRTAEFPDRAGFDYAAQWEKPYEGDFEKPWNGNISRTRDYNNRVFEGIREKFPELWKDGRLTRIPGGELFYELDKKMQAGEMPGITTIKDFYTDVQHIRAGMAAYSIAALFYAAIFEDKPDALDFDVYNDTAEYGDDPHHDRGPVEPVTPERAKVLHETIWEVLQNHPHTWGRAERAE